MPSLPKNFFIQIVETSRSIGLNYRLQEQSNTTESKKKSFGIKMSKDDIAICKFDFALIYN